MVGTVGGGPGGGLVVVVVVDGGTVVDGAVVVGGAVVDGIVVVVTGPVVLVGRGGIVVVVGGTVVEDAVVVDAVVGGGAVVGGKGGAVDVVVVEPVAVGSEAGGSEAGGSAGDGAEAFATPAAVKAEPASVPTDSGTISTVVSRRRRWDTGTSPGGKAERLLVAGLRVTARSTGGLGVRAGLGKPLRTGSVEDPGEARQDGKLDAHRPGFHRFLFRRPPETSVTTKDDRSDRQVQEDRDSSSSGPPSETFGSGSDRR